MDPLIARIQLVEHKLGVSTSTCDVDLNKLRSSLYDLRDSISCDQTSISRLSEENSLLKKENEGLRIAVERMNYRIRHLVKELDQVDPNPTPRVQQ
ncbi:hypothetical protein GEMRC1_004411 [Eukaryota sp. GEM-RC1]